MPLYVTQLLIFIFNVYSLQKKKKTEIRTFRILSREMQEMILLNSAFC